MLICLSTWLFEAKTKSGPRSKIEGELQKKTLNIRVREPLLLTKAFKRLRLSLLLSKLRGFIQKLQQKQKLKAILKARKALKT